MAEKTLIYRGGCIVKNLGSSDKNRDPDYKPSEIATTLLSRDYKGLSNYASNGVIEIWKLSKSETQCREQTE